MKILKIAIAAATLAAALPAQAAIVVDGTPTGPTVANWQNQTNGQNFLVKFTLGASTVVKGFDIFTRNPFAALGQGVKVKIRSDAGGIPALSNLFSFDETIDTNTAFGELKIAGTNFEGINLAAGTYWFGVSGLNSELGWSSFNNGGSASNTNQSQLSGDTILGTPGINSLAFRIRGDVGAVPEPATWLMLLFGFAAIGASMRYRRITTKVKFA